jgi:manganese transport protein
MEGFLGLRINPTLRRLITRLFAITPALITTLAMGERGLNSLLILSQVILSCALPFAVIPLVYFTSSRVHMCPDADASGIRLHEPRFVNGWIMTIVGWTIAAIVTCLNVYLVVLAIVE